VKLVVVLGYSDGRSDGLHPICAARLERAAAECADADAVVLSGHGRRRVAIPEAELMRQAWRWPAARLICEPRARITAENAARAAAVARELGAREVVVVTSWWHRLRTRILFGATLRGSGATLRLASAGRPWSLRLLLRELGAFALVPLQLRRLRLEDEGGGEDGEAPGDQILLVADVDSREHEEDDGGEQHDGPGGGPVHVGWHGRSVRRRLPDSFGQRLP
jgi:hypothetical protein